jgi:hypothetical protein
MMVMGIPSVASPTTNRAARPIPLFPRSPQVCKVKFFKFFFRRKATPSIDSSGANLFISAKPTCLSRRRQTPELQSKDKVKGF